MEQERLPSIVDLLDHPLVLGNNQAPNVVLVEQGSRFESQVISKAAHAVDIAELRQKLSPNRRQDIPHLLEQIHVELLVIHFHVAQVLQAYQVLHHFEHAVSHASDGPHSLRHGLPQCFEVVGKCGKIQVSQAVPGIFFKVLPGLDYAFDMAAQRAAARQDGVMQHSYDTVS